MICKGGFFRCLSGKLEGLDCLSHRYWLSAKYQRKNPEINQGNSAFGYRPRVTITLGIDQRNAHQPFAVAQWLEGEWEHNPVMEGLLIKGIRPAIHISPARLTPGRVMAG